LAEALKFIKVKCKNCGFLNLIPVTKRLIVDEPVKLFKLTPYRICSFTAFAASALMLTARFSMLCACE